MTGTLQGYIKASNWAEAIASYIFDKHGGMLDMMRFLSTGLHIPLVSRSVVPESLLLLCDASLESAGQQELPQSTIVAENGDLGQDFVFWLS